MDKELIERLAQQAIGGPGGYLEKFATLIADECAKLADEQETHGENYATEALRECAAEIRARFAP